MESSHDAGIPYGRSEQRMTQQWWTNLSYLKRSVMQCEQASATNHGASMESASLHRKMVHDRMEPTEMLNQMLYTKTFTLDRSTLS